MNYGYHMSITKKSLYRSLLKEVSMNPFCKSFQIFLKSPQRMSLSGLNDEDVKNSRNMIKDNDINIFIHSSYLINIGNIIDEKVKSIILDDFIIGDRVSGKGVIFHVGKHCNRFTEEECLDLMINNINMIIEETKDLEIKFILETGCNCGTEVCTSIDRYKYIYDKIDRKDRFGFCIDTCHIFVAGYDINEYIKEFTSIIDEDLIKVIHFNNSMSKKGSKLDRHDNIYRGYISVNEMRDFGNYFFSRNIPIILETPDNDNRQIDIDTLYNWFSTK